MSRESIIATTKRFEVALQRYQDALKSNPGSTYYAGLVKNTQEYIEELKEELEKLEGSKPKLINEATSTDIKVINQLQSLGWKAGDTLLYQQEYKLTREQQSQFTEIKSIKPDIVLQDMNGVEA